jgi:hypothetical protein
LVSLELVHAHRGAHGVYLYSLAWDGEGAAEAGGMLLPGLIDPDQHVYDGNRSGSAADRSALEVDWSGGGRPPVGAWSGGGRPARNGSDPSSDGQFQPPDIADAGNHGSGVSFLAAEAAVAAEAELRRAG